MFYTQCNGKNGMNLKVNRLVENCFFLNPFELFKLLLPSNWYFLGQIDRREKIFISDVNFSKEIKKCRSKRLKFVCENIQTIFLVNYDWSHLHIHNDFWIYLITFIYIQTSGQKHKAPFRPGYLSFQSSYQMVLYKSPNLLYRHPPIPSLTFRSRAWFVFIT